MAGILVALVVSVYAAGASPDPSCPPCGGGGEAESQSAAVSAGPEEPELDLDLGGALRFNFQYQEWQRREFTLKDFGNFEFDTFRLNVDGSYGDILFSAEYRFYAGYHFLHHGWVGYDFSDKLGVEVGVHKVPFGALPYASHNWFFQLAYYVGLEDDYDAGAKVVYEPGPWDLRLAFYVNDEGDYTGSSLASARYSYDVVPALPGELGGGDVEDGRFNEEVNQLNARVAYPLSYGGGGEIEVGASGQWGLLQNTLTDDFGSRWALGVHADATFGRWNVKAEALRYEFDPETLPGQDDRFVAMGAYDAPYKVAAEAWLYMVGAAYTLPVKWGPIRSVQLYDDYSYLHKSEDDFSDTQQNVVGALLSAGPLLIYVDLASGKNHPWLGPDYVEALAEGGGEEGWSTRFNVNIGFYF